MIQQTLNGAWQFRKAGEQAWLPASVPGGVHTDLMALGRIPDPFVADNELKVMWVAESDWEYRHTFNADATLLDEEHVNLVCDGLDTLATVYLNSKLLGTTDNMFCQQRWAVKDLLQPGENELVLHFASAVRYCAEKDGDHPQWTPTGALRGATHLRKAPCHFGWDWGPQLPAIGIWKDIYLQGRRGARLGDVHVRQQHVDGDVTLSVDAAVEDWQAGRLDVRLTLTMPDGKISMVVQPVSDGQASLDLLIKKPRLWWPNGYGAQPLYQARVELLHNGTTLEERHYQVGLRTLELRQEPDRWGRSFTFVVNGVPIFAKGGNWIPADSFPTRITRPFIEHLIASSAAANQNMLRVWGGGTYESEDFYDLCDRYGILVWQDFMFACAIYPFNDPAFVENVHQEVVQNVKRIRHRACLAVWCGNNEMESGWVSWGWDTPANADLKAADKAFFYHTLPGWVSELDPDTAYWPSSPSSHVPHEIPNSNATGDNHLWEVWHAMKPHRFYREQFPRFASEFGFQSLPALETVAGYAAPEDWNMTSRIMEHHQRNSAGNSKIITYMTDGYRLPDSFDSLVYLTQVQQAEAVRIAVEHWRRNRAICSGALYWQTNDCWPVASWSSIDYAGRWKALHYAARRFYAPVLLSVEDDGDKMALSVTNDTPQAWNGEVRWSLETLGGQALQSGSVDVSAAPLANTPVKMLDFSGQLDYAARAKRVFIAELWKDQQSLALTVSPFLKDKHVELEDAQLEVRLERRGKQLVIYLLAASLARFVEVWLEGADVVFSDNFIDLPVGRVMRVTCPMPEGWTLRQARSALRVRSLYDSYEHLMEIKDEL